MKALINTFGSLKQKNPTSNNPSKNSSNNKEDHHLKTQHASSGMRITLMDHKGHRTNLVDPEINKTNGKTKGEEKEGNPNPTAHQPPKKIKVVKKSYKSTQEHPSSHLRSSVLTNSSEDLQNSCVDSNPSRQLEIDDLFIMRPINAFNLPFPYPFLLRTSMDKKYIRATDYNMVEDIKSKVCVYKVLNIINKKQYLCQQFETSSTVFYGNDNLQGSEEKSNTPGAVKRKFRKLQKWLEHLVKMHRMLEKSKCVLRLIEVANERDHVYIIFEDAEKLSRDSPDFATNFREILDKVVVGVSEIASLSLSVANFYFGNVFRTKNEGYKIGGFGLGLKANLALPELTRGLCSISSMTDSGFLLFSNEGTPQKYKEDLEDPKKRYGEMRYFVAPETISQGLVTKSSDCWALGLFIAHCFREEIPGYQNLSSVPKDEKILNRFEKSKSSAIEIEEKTRQQQERLKILKKQIMESTGIPHKYRILIDLMLKEDHEERLEVMDVLKQKQIFDLDHPDLYRLIKASYRGNGGRSARSSSRSYLTGVRSKRFGDKSSKKSSTGLRLKARVNTPDQIYRHSKMYEKYTSLKFQPEMVSNRGVGGAGNAKNGVFEENRKFHSGFVGGREMVIEGGDVGNQPSIELLGTDSRILSNFFEKKKVGGPLGPGLDFGSLQSQNVYQERRYNEKKESTSSRFSRNHLAVKNRQKEEKSQNSVRTKSAARSVANTSQNGREESARPRTKSQNCQKPIEISPRSKLKNKTPLAKKGQKQPSKPLNQTKTKASEALQHNSMMYFTPNSEFHHNPKNGNLQNSTLTHILKQSSNRQMVAEKQDRLNMTTTSDFFNRKSKFRKKPKNRFVSKNRGNMGTNHQNNDTLLSNSKFSLTSKTMITYDSRQKNRLKRMGKVKQLIQMDNEFILGDLKDKFKTLGEREVEDRKFAREMEIEFKRRIRNMDLHELDREIEQAQRQMKSAKIASDSVSERGGIRGCYFDSIDRIFDYFGCC